VTAARADRESKLPAQPSVAIQTNFVILFMGSLFKCGNAASYELYVV
jgi:hypothetical protein